MLFILTVAHSTPAVPLSPRVTTAFNGIASRSAIFAAQNASKSAGLGSAARIAVGATAAPSSTRPAPPVLRLPKLVSGVAGLTSTTSIAGSASELSIRARPVES